MTSAPTSTQHWLVRLRPTLTRHWRAFALASIVSIIGAAAIGLGPLVQRAIVDDAIDAGTRALWPLLVALLGIAALNALAIRIRRFAGSRFATGVQHDLRVAMFAHVQRLDEATREQFGSGDLISRATADVTLIQSFLQQWHVIAAHATSLIVGIVALTWISPPLALIVFAVIPLVGVAARRLRATVFPSSWVDQRAAAAVTATVADTVVGIRVVKAFGQIARETERYARRARELFRSRRRTIGLTGRYGATLAAMPSLGQLAVLAVGGTLAIRGSISVGTFIAANAYVAQLANPARMLANSLANAQQARAGAERVLDLLDADPGIDWGTIEPDAVRGEVRFDDVTFGYEPDVRVLDRLSLQVPAGSTLAIVARTAAGSSTVTRLLQRRRDVDGGEISLDGIDLRRLSSRALHRHVAVVADDGFVFSASVVENIAFARPDATIEEVRAAARAACIDDEFTALPQGYDTAVGERGLTLSGGQRQRLLLARALLADPTVLVLDAATSAVDPVTEAEIHAHIRDLRRTSTTLIIAQRRSTLAHADRIAVLDGGRIVDAGQHDELVQRSEIYREVCGESEVSAATAAALRPPRPGDPERRAAAPTTLRNSDTATRSPDRRSELVAATPALLDGVSRLPPLDGEPDEQLAAHTPDTQLRLRSTVAPYRRAIAGALALVAASSVLALASPLVIRAGIDRAIVPSDRRALALIVAVLAAAVVLSFAATWSTAVHTGRTAERILYVLRVRTYRHALRLPTAYFDREPSGRTTARLTADVDALSQLFSSGLVSVIVSLATSIAVAVTMFVLEWRLALGQLAVIAVALVATAVFRRHARGAHSRTREALAAVYADLHEGFAGAQEVQLHEQNARHTTRFADTSAGHRAARLASVRLISTYFPAIQFLSVTAVAVSYALGAMMIERNQLTLGVLIAFVLLVDQFFAPVQQLAQLLDQWIAAHVALGRLQSLHGEVEDETNRAGRHRAAPMPINVQQVDFTYPGRHRPALRGVDARLGAGQRIAIVGPTGAGKSTLAKLIVGFYPPTHGSVLIGDRDAALPADGAGAVGYVPQEPHLFEGTLHDNIAYGVPDATRDDVERAARKVGAHDLIAQLPNGYDTSIETSRRLSAGQRQLVCLARAVAVEPSVLVLDEATAHLDERSETAVTAGIGRAGADCTTISIAHRLQTVAGSDRILVVDDGAIVQDGGHDDLSSTPGLYRSLWQRSQQWDDTLQQW
ncbi:MAG: ABC transporter ATP-binding protein [Actinomycetota bacterium]